MTQTKARKVPCARCRAENPDYLSFGVGGRGRGSRKFYCLHHIPWYIRLKMWWRERG